MKITKYFTVLFHILRVRVDSVKKVQEVEGIKVQLLTEE